MPRTWNILMAYPVVFATEEADARAERDRLASQSEEAGTSASYAVRDAGKCYRVLETIRISSYRGMTGRCKAYRKLSELKAQLGPGSMAEFTVTEGKE